MFFIRFLGLLLIAAVLIFSGILLFCISRLEKEIEKETDLSGEQ